MYNPDAISVSEDRATIRKLREGWENTTYGMMKFKTSDGGRVRWGIKINQMEKYCVVGIDECDVDESNTETSFWDSDESIHYAWAGDNGTISGTVIDRGHEWTEFSNKFGDGDIVYVELDANAMTVSFGINVHDGDT